MFRLNKLTDYGIVLMAHVARSHEGVQHTARSLAKETRIRRSSAMRCATRWIMSCCPI